MGRYRGMYIGIITSKDRGVYTHSNGALDKGGYIAKIINRYKGIYIKFRNKYICL
jgi:hypothetical protein